MGMFDVKVDGGLFSGIGDAVSGIINAVKGQVPPEKAAEIELRARELENALLVGQMEINKIEASSSSMFVAGWRPALGWICAIGIAANFLVFPVLDAYKVLPKPISFDMGTLMTLVLSLLGLGTMRTLEKSKGVQGKH